MLDSLAVCSCCRGPPRRSLMTLSTYTPHFICMDAVEFLFWYKIDVFRCTVALNMHQELLILCCRGRLETAVALDLSFRFKKTKKQLWAASSCFWLSVQAEWDDFPAVLLMQPPSGCGGRPLPPTELDGWKVTLQNTHLMREKSLKAVKVLTRREHQLLAASAFRIVF